MTPRARWAVPMLACMVLAGCALEPRSAAPEASTAETASDQTSEARADLPAAGPELLNSLIAKVEATGGGGPGDFGSAIIIGRASGDIRLITAKHVVTSGRDLQTRQLRAYEQIEVEFWFDRGTQHVARLEPMADSALDLAVLVVRETAALAQRLEDLPFDFESLLRRVRSPAALQLHDGLFTIGHPNGIPWYSAPFELDRVLTVDEDEIEFRSGFINTGHSGGALFSQDWYLVGMITHDRLPGGRALRIDRIVAQLEAWDQHVALAVPALPPPPGVPLRDCPDCPELVQLPPGTFVMGAEENAIDPSRNETPRHEVTIAAPFLVGRYEVTHEEFRAFIEATGHETSDGCEIWTKNKRAWQWDGDKSWRDPGYPVENDRRPVVCVEWGDAQAYVDWLTRTTGHGYRLPSAAEWEYAARAWTNTRYWWGDHLPDNRAACAECGSRWDLGRAAPVGSFAPNFFGLYDVHGNVWEWVEDCWHDRYVDAPADGSAWLEEAGGNCAKRVMRGGSSVTTAETMRSANRLKDSPDNRQNSVGFRVVRDL